MERNDCVSRLSSPVTQLECKAPSGVSLGRLVLMEAPLAKCSVRLFLLRRALINLITFHFASGSDTNDAERDGGIDAEEEALQQ